MAFETTSQQVQASYTLPDNFNLKQDPDSKSKAISQRVSDIFSQNKGKIALFALLTLPLFPITWAIGYLAIRHSAKSDVISALAEKRLELLSNKGEIGQFIKDAKTSGESLPENFRGAANLLENELSQTKFSTYFKTKHSLLVSSANAPKTTDKNTNLETWKAFKTAANTTLSQVTEARMRIQKKFHMTDKQLDDALYAMLNPNANPEEMPQNSRAQIMKTLSTASLFLQTLNKFETKIDSFLPAVRTAKREENQTQILGDIEVGITKGLNKVLRELQNERPLNINNNPNLPIVTHISRDAIGKLPACGIGSSKYKETPMFKQLLNAEDQTHTTLLAGDDAQKTAYKELMATKIVHPQLRLYNEITQAAANSGMSDETKKKLWVMLQLSRTQAFLQPLDAMPALLCSGNAAFVTNDTSTKQNIYVEYQYNKKNNSLDIIFHRRFELLGIGNEKVPVPYYLYGSVKMTIDLAIPELATSYKIQAFEPIPVSHKMPLFDSLHDGGIVPVPTIYANTRQHEIDPRILEQTEEVDATATKGIGTFADT